ncbi:MAG: serine/threonine protein kinase [Sylvanvirus sp.]|uniref:Serine/threonine protein kinase n=1 Tax=Sylvanvirus sp. TaxID=2487774 RepID=A0A3G5AL05_9VIRU|nr:MAG: serine/threonine protein kinase [Sylvanvirus sp.]
MSLSSCNPSEWAQDPSILRVPSLERWLSQRCGTNTNNDVKNTNRYSIPTFKLQIIGEGSFGTVYKCGTQQVVKVITTTTEQQCLNARREAMLPSMFQQTCGNNHFNDCHLVVPSESFRLYIINEDRYATSLIMPFVQGGSASQFLDPHTHTVWSPESLFNNIESLIHTLFAIHEDQFAHTDIKPANLLVESSTKTLYLADFGGTCKVDQQYLNLNPVYQGDEKNINASTLSTNPSYSCSKGYDRTLGYIPLTSQENRQVNDLFSGDMFALSITFQELVLGYSYYTDYEKKLSWKWTESKAIIPPFIKNQFMNIYASRTSQFIRKMYPILQTAASKGQPQSQRSTSHRRFQENEDFSLLYSPETSPYSYSPYSPQSIEPFESFEPVESTQTPYSPELVEFGTSQTSESLPPSLYTRLLYASIGLIYMAHPLLATVRPTAAQMSVVVTTDDLRPTIFTNVPSTLTESFIDLFNSRDVTALKIESLWDQYDLSAGTRRPIFPSYSFQSNSTHYPSNEINQNQPRSGLAGYLPPWLTTFYEYVNPVNMIKRRNQRTFQTNALNALNERNGLNVQGESQAWLQEALRPTTYDTDLSFSRSRSFTPSSRYKFDEYENVN